MQLTATVPFDADMPTPRDHIRKMARLDEIDTLIDKHAHAIREERHYRLTHATDARAVAESWASTYHHRARIDVLCAEYDRITGCTHTA